MKILPLLRSASILLSASAWIGAITFAQDAPAKKLAPVLQPFVDNHILAGAVVLVADPDKVLDVEAVGWADIAAEKPMRPDTVFWIASQSKPIAATALMILVDEGKVNVDDPVEKYLPEFKGQQVNVSADPAHPELKAPSHPILVREVLSHTSGLPFSTKIEQPTLDVLPLATRVQSYAKEALLFEPGTKSRYANAGINTAGRIVEVVSGMSFEKFLDERIFQPLGMTDTTFYPSKSQIERLAKSYKPNAAKDGLEEITIGQLKYPLDDPDRRPMPAGGLFSTANDLSIFYRMMANDGVFNGKRILSEKAVKTMTSDQSGAANSHYGFGFATDGKSFTHGGAYGTNSRFDLQRKLITVFLVQHAGWSGNGKDILHQFQVAATDAYGANVAGAAKSDVSHLVVGINSAPDTKAAPDAKAAAAKTNAPVVVTRVRFLPAPDREQALVGGKIAGSNVSSTEGFKTLAEIKEAPKRGEWGEIQLDNATPYRWVRYEAPAGSHGNVAELEFYAGDTKLRGQGFGSPGGAWRAALDGKPETWSNSATADGQYAGLDLEDQAATARPVITPGGGDSEKPQTVSMRCATPGATIRFTLDGTIPTAQSGVVFTKPFTIEKNAMITAVAFSDSLAPSPAALSTLWIGAQPHPTMNSFHVGNSLTGNASRFRVFIRTAGGRDDFPAYLIGGSLTVKLWNESQGADKKRWDETYAKAVHPLDYFTMQPRDFNVAQEADYDTRFIKLVREKSPEVQPWLYAEWVEMSRARPSDKGEVPSFQMKKTFPALTWQESMGAMLLYNEEVQHQILGQYREGKPVRIIPTALAMGWARTLIDQGKFPGVSPGENSFYGALFDDQVHVNPSGCYLVSLTWYAALYHESPEGKLLPIGTNLTSEQALLLQRLAWDVVKNYPDCGLYEKGTEPCGKPEIANDGKTITLKSATPGAWFRYTLDGTEPTRANGYIYCGAISVQPGISVKAVAYRSGMADSEVAAQMALTSTARGAAPSSLVLGPGAPNPIAPVLQSFVDKHIAPGVVALVANKDGVLALEKAGYASLADKTPIRDDAVFWIASMSKSLTATALMMLVDEGKVSLDDPVEKYLPEFKGQMVAGPDGQDAPHPPKHPITVREIMDHTSGLVLASEKSFKHSQVLKDEVAETAAHPLRQEPGTKYEYNNCGINTGGRIIEVVSGMPYGDFMQRRLFDPLGMKDTTCWPNEEQASRLAHTARFTEDKKDLVEIKLDPSVNARLIEKLSLGVHVPAAITGDMGFGIAGDYGQHYAMPAGGYFSTAHDLSLLCRMLLRGGELEGKHYLSEKAVHTMSSNQTGDVKVSPQEGYGVGVSVKLKDEEGPAVGSFGHRGARRTAMWIDPRNGLAMIILVERFDMPGDQQTVMYGDFMKAAVAKFGAAAASR